MMPTPRPLLGKFMPRRVPVLLAAIASLAAVDSPVRLAAQTSRADPTDLQAWYSIGLDVDLPKKLSTSFDFRLRTEDNASAYRGSYLGGELAYSPLKRVSLLANYRYASVDGERSNRVGLGAEAGTKFVGLSWSLRGLVQHRLQGADEEENGKTLYRTRLRAKRALSDNLDLYASSEPYFARGEAYPIDNWRNTVGLKLGYGGGRTADLFYIYRPDYAKKYNRTFHVVGMALGFGTKLGGASKSKKKDKKSEKKKSEKKSEQKATQPMDTLQDSLAAAQRGAK